MNNLPMWYKKDPIFKYKLMLKQHYETGINYLCITTKDKWQEYKGSGLSWKKLIKKYPSKILTTLIFTSEDKDYFNKICVEYSKLLNVVDSDIFANLILESGVVDKSNRIRKSYNKPHNSKAGLTTKLNKKGIFDPDLQHLRINWAKIGAAALNNSGNRKGCATKEWIENNKELQKINASKGGKKGGLVTGKMFWWNNGIINKKSFTSPGIDWKRGMLMSEKKKAQVYLKLAGNNKKEKKND